MTTIGTQPGELSPCPFCGSDRVQILRRHESSEVDWRDGLGSPGTIHFAYTRVYCGACGGCLELLNSSDDLVISSWNRRTPAAKPERNQCDGCCANMPLNARGIHVDSDGRSFMCCTAERYKVAAKPEAPVRVVVTDDYDFRLFDANGKQVSHMMADAICAAINAYFSGSRSQQVMNEYRIAVETHATNPPTPIGFAVFADDKLVAVLTEEQVRKALAQFDELKAARL